MVDFTLLHTQTQTLEQLIAEDIASRVHQQDASVFSFSEQAQEISQQFMGWTQLASKPLIDIEQLQAFAQDMIHEGEGLERIILIGEGGSSQAPMTITKLHALEGREIRFSTLDSLSPLYLHKILGDSDISRAAIIVSSKSGTTLETLSLAEIIWDFAVSVLGEEHAGKRFIAITDPNTKLEQLARKRSFRAVFNGNVSVGGRFSALSVFGLVPAALVGMDLKLFLKEAQETEVLCAENSKRNPALQLAAFLYDHVSKDSAYAFSFMSPQPGRVLGLWIEQMIAESLGKNSKGIVPQIAIDPQLLNDPYEIRPVVTYSIKNYPEFEAIKSQIDNDIPQAHFSINSPYELGSHFLIWEYATAFLGYLLKRCPFDQPDVQSAKVNTSRALYGLLPNYAFTLKEPWLVAEASQALSKTFSQIHPETLDILLDSFFSQVKKGSWTALNCFLPFTGDRREPLERMRWSIARYLGAPSCLEIGPRYLHSTGQLQKGGKNNGVFLILSATEDDDILIPHESHSLGDIIIAQAKGDLVTLSNKGRKALHLHLSDNHAETLNKLAEAVEASCKRVGTYN